MATVTSCENTLYTCKLFHVNMKIDVICHCKNCTFILTKDETIDAIKICSLIFFLLASVY